MQDRPHNRQSVAPSVGMRTNTLKLVVATPPRSRHSAAQSVVIRSNSLKMVVVPLNSPFRKYRSFSCYNRSPSLAEVELRLQAPFNRFWAVMAIVLKMDKLHSRHSAAQSVVIRTNSLKLVIVPLTAPFRKYRS